MSSTDPKPKRRWIIRNVLDAVGDAPVWLRAELFGAFIGLIVLGNLGYTWFGVLGAIIGGIVGLIAGFALALIIRIMTMF